MKRLKDFKADQISISDAIGGYVMTMRTCRDSTGCVDGVSDTYTQTTDDNGIEHSSSITYEEDGCDIA